MDSPALEEKVLIAWSSIHNMKQSNIFIFKCKNKNSIYGCADMCAFSKGENPFWSPGAKFEVSGLLEKGSFWVGGEGGDA